MADDFARYLDALAGSWQAFAAPHRDARLVLGPDLFGLRHPDPVLNNAVVRKACAIGEATQFFAGAPSFALWTADHDLRRLPGLRGSMVDAGLQPDTSTVPMVVDLAARAAEPAGASDQSHRVIRGIDSGAIAEMNGLDGALVRGVPGAIGYATADGLAGLLAIERGDDVNISFVVTAPSARRKGRARTLLRAALTDAAARGSATASLQATPTAEGLYVGAGFEPVGRWQEWVPVIAPS